MIKIYLLEKEKEEVHLVRTETSNLQSQKEEIETSINEKGRKQFKKMGCIKHDGREIGIEIFCILLL